MAVINPSVTVESLDVENICSVHNLPEVSFYCGVEKDESNDTLSVDLHSLKTNT